MVKGLLGSSTVLDASLEERVDKYGLKSMNTSKIREKKESRKRERCVDSEDEGGQLSSERKNLIADLIVVVAEEDRMKLPKESGYAISDRSLRRWQ